VGSSPTFGTNDEQEVIFDLNGIFIQSPKLSERFEKDFIPKLSEIMDKVRQPHAGDSFQYWEPVLREWNINLSERAFWDYWFKTESVSEPNFKERAEYYAHYPWIHNVIEKAYFSWQSGFIKPNPEAWLQILRDNNLKPEECLYFDDQEKNVKAAESVGIKSFLFTTEEDLRVSVNSFS
jgi:beta-phosphoglucomutase-like phosphatase (HAD superfamily)